MPSCSPWSNSPTSSVSGIRNLPVERDACEADTLKPAGMNIAAVVEHPTARRPDCLQECVRWRKAPDPPTVLFAGNNLKVANKIHGGKSVEKDLVLGTTVSKDRGGHGGRIAEFGPAVGQV